MKTFTVADPAQFDGDPFEVAERALLQAAGVASVLASVLPGARVMMRNAHLERELGALGECFAEDFDDNPAARRLEDVVRAVGEVETTLKALATASAYNPRKPRKE